MISQINEALCSGCLVCKGVCPYKAIEEKTITERVGGKPVERLVASVNTGLYQGCGNCTVACRAGAANLKGYERSGYLRRWMPCVDRYKVFSPR